MAGKTAVAPGILWLAGLAVAIQVQAAFNACIYRAAVAVGILDGLLAVPAFCQVMLIEQIGGIIALTIVEFIQHDDVRSHPLQNFSHLLQAGFLSGCKVLAQLPFFLQAHGDIEGRYAELI